MNELEPFETKLAGLIGNLSPQSRKALAVTIAKRLRASQQQNIKRQQAPDGTPYAPRKTQLRSKQGRIKRAMFTKLRTTRYLKANGNNNAAVVDFVGRVKRMVEVHHYGLRDRPSLHSPEVKYEERPLLGFSNKERDVIQSIVMQYLEKNN
ncbi:phage virion morphogenesis protein [Serratia fonticola]|uniref:phage virion morphogenesis protein n=1 Tax=Serratia fonticola TaxID=47917 RepID=UPI0027F86B5F|nr:phage virion morphogenesis protein [Serratia fonticola]MDQ7210927.1 phage virion morphogenesis protein [Serratia fonticola]HBE9080979.1 phage virion morphogenesis protein [Serratia fonticola]HBE9091505.1 phage virion morphogenesis protein [Serratia fonticola]HBE9153999.1 phage virion morphogenesis protein [Serratia fonticola]